jgi:ketosteroid isomerase-like protein
MCLQFALLFLSAFTLRAGVTPITPDIGAVWAADWSARRLDHVLTLYAPDAIFYTSGGDRISGIPAIRTLFQSAMKSGNSTIHLERAVTEQSGKLAYESGDYQEMLVSGANHRGLQGHYLLVLRKQNGHWLIVEQMWTGGSVPTRGSGFAGLKSRSARL